MASQSICSVKGISEEGERDDWVLLNEGKMKGTRIIVAHETGDVAVLSTRCCRDADRWRDEMPSLQSYATLQVLDLHNSRYIRSLHESVGALSSLKRLVLSRCDRLESLPESVGDLQSLEEVR